MNETQYFRLSLRARQTARAFHSNGNPVFTKPQPRQRLPAPPPFPRDQIHTTTAPCRAECHNDSSRAPYDIPEGTRFRIECRDSDTHTTCTRVNPEGQPVPLTPGGFCYRFALPNDVIGIANRTNEGEPRTLWIEAGHGLRVKPTHEILEERHHTGWYVDQHQSETVRAFVIILPKRRGFLLAASDPWNDDAFTVENDAPEPFDATRYRWNGTSKEPVEIDGQKEAARLAERFTERLAEDYRDDAEHQQAIQAHEEAEEERKKAIQYNNDEADRMEREAAAIAEEMDKVQHPAPHARLASLKFARREAGQLHRKIAQELTDQDPPEEPTTPNFNYFGKAKR